MHIYIENAPNSAIFSGEQIHLKDQTMVSTVSHEKSQYWTPNLSQSPMHSGRHAAAALRWLETMRANEEWALSVDEQCELLGGVAKRTLQGWKKKAVEGEEVDLSRDMMERLSLLLGIYKGYQLIAPTNRPEIASQWFKTPNDNELFQGKSVKGYLLTEGTMNALYSVRRYLDAARG